MILRLFMLASWAVVTMTAQELVQPNLDGFKYPALARAARVQGTVQFVVKSDGAQLVSGQPLLVPAAKSNLEKWAVPYTSETPLSVTYIFRIRIETVEVDELIGNGLDRFFLRLFRRPVTRRIKRWDCHPKDTPAVYKNETKDGLPSIEIEIGSGAMCLETDTVALAALRH